MSVWLDRPRLAFLVVDLTRRLVRRSPPTTAGLPCFLWAGDFARAGRAALELLRRELVF